MTAFGVIDSGQSMCPRMARPWILVGGVREQMLLDEPIVGKNIVADEEHELASRTLDAQVASGPGPG